MGQGESLARLRREEQPPDPGTLVTKEGVVTISRRARCRESAYSRARLPSSEHKHGAARIGHDRQRGVWLAREEEEAQAEGRGRTGKDKGVRKRRG